MRFLPATVLLLLLAAPAVSAAEETAEGGAGESRTLIFQIVNFAILAGGLAWLAKKYGGPYFASRSESIRNGIAEAESRMVQAEERARSIERRLAGLHEEIGRLRAVAQNELAAERQRFEQETERAVRRVFAQAEQEIAAISKAARLELKAYAASLAIGLAEQRIASRITRQTQRELVEDFVRSLDS